jgi:NAD(P)-dependent dehydrogenase (short-subunit alcohol dehydrogenase family)
MATERPLIVITGGNRGIGFEICRQLAQRGAQVILTARSERAGLDAVEKLAAERLNATFQLLDVTKEQDLETLRNFLAGSHGHIDVLINNAGVLHSNDEPGLTVRISTLRATLDTNTLAPLRLGQVLAPLLRKSRGGRIINISSGMGALESMGGDHAAYRISKAALNAVTRVLAAELEGSVAVNSVCPGWVKTDMGGPGAEREPAQGAETAVWLAFEAPQSLTGKFLRDRQVIPW